MQWPNGEEFVIGWKIGVQNTMGKEGQKLVAGVEREKEGLWEPKRTCK